ncbi:MAG TPA: hypothetical protein VL971_09755 [Rhizomicrobium sp.]|jgi:hypothetical protein|nr:hypothetical protein [Rhizomicrobium sp.]
MKSDSERQTAYQKRRAETEVRVAFWMGKDVDQMVEKLRGSESRSDWLNRAVNELMYRQLTGKKFSQLYTSDDDRRAVQRSRELGVKLPG